MCMCVFVCVLLGQFDVKWLVFKFSLKFPFPGPPWEAPCIVVKNSDS